MEGGVSTGGPAPTKGRIHPVYLAILASIVAPFLPFGLAGLRFLGGTLLVASLGTLLTLVIWPSGLTLASRLLRGFGLGLLVAFYTGFWLAKFHLLNILIVAEIAETLAILPFAITRGGKAVRQHFEQLKQPLPRFRPRWAWVVAVLLIAFFLCLLMRNPSPFPIGQPDAGFFYGLAKEIDKNNGTIGTYPYLDPPAGRNVDFSTQGFSLLSVIISRTFGLPLLLVCQCFPLFSFLILAISVFLIGREIGGERGALLALFFLCTLSGLVEPFQLKNFDRDGLNATLSGWVGYFLLRIFSARTFVESLQAGCLLAPIYGLFALIWPGWLYLIPCMIGSVLLAPVLRLLSPAGNTKVSAVVARVSGGVALAVLLSSALALPFGRANWSDLAGAVSAYLRGESARLHLGNRPESLLDLPIYGESSGCLLFALSLMLLGVVYVYLSKREILSPIVTWLILLAAIVWPSAGFTRFYMLWAPLLSPLASAGILLLTERIPKSLLPLSLLVLLFAIPFLLINAAQAYPFRNVGDGDAAEAIEWISKNTPRGSLFAGDWYLGYQIASTERVSLCDPASWMSYSEEWDGVSSLPGKIGRQLGGEFVTADTFIPWEGFRTAGRCVDFLRWVYLDAEELENMLRWYADRGIRVNYLYCFDNYELGYSIAAVRKGDILEWAKPSRSGDILQIGFREDNIEISLRNYPPRLPLHLGTAPLVARGGRGPYAVIVALRIQENELFPARIVFPSDVSTVGTILLVEGEEGELAEAALVRPHPFPTLGEILSLRGAPKRENLTLPHFLEPVFSSSRQLVRVFRVKA